MQMILARSWTVTLRTQPRWSRNKFTLRPFLPQLAQSGLMVPGTPGYRSRPTEADRMHCVAFVISARAVSVMDPSIVDKFKAVLAQARARRKTVCLTCIYKLFSKAFTPLSS